MCIHVIAFTSVLYKRIKEKKEFINSSEDDAHSKAACCMFVMLKHIILCFTGHSPKGLA